MCVYDLSALRARACAHTHTHTPFQLGRSNALHLSDADRETGLQVGSHRFRDVADRRGARVCATFRIITDSRVRASAVYATRVMGH
jgi:hypothetical protein